VQPVTEDPFEDDDRARQHLLEVSARENAARSRNQTMMRIGLIGIIVAVVALVAIVVQALR
jgi:hypothetical protein